MLNSVSWCNFDLWLPKKTAGS
uniref:Uncharacterized protein n=1 Tax=Anguilla anguilla TaxID=7936 RepID=A0A0E9XFK7_ANGAN